MEAIILGLDGLEPSLARRYDCLSLEYRGFTQAETSKTPVAWTEFATGLSMSEHGITDFWHPSGRAWLSTDIKRPSYWWNRLDYTVGVLDVPVVTSPARPINGWMVGGHTIYPESRWPADLPEIDPRYDAYDFPVGWAQLAWDHEPLWAEVIKQIDVCVAFARYHVRTTKEAIERLMAARPVDILVVYQHISDNIGHGFLTWHREVCEQTYYMLNALARWLWKTYDPELKIVLSDHGMVPVEQDSLRHHRRQVTVDGQVTWEGMLNVPRFGQLYTLCSGAHSDDPPGHLASNHPMFQGTWRLRDIGDAIVGILQPAAAGDDVRHHLAALGYL